jgi:peptidoglycan/LPS O-acetylase OafA/YrhL
MGIAVLIVVLFHLFQHNNEFTPYSDRLLSWTSFGYLGVHLFFMVSGFVIAFTLERGSRPLDFAIRRFLRLWPPILICSVLTFTIMHSVETPFSEARRVRASGFLPSLTFIQSFVWNKIIPVDIYIDGAYWSLFVEVRFYFWALVLAMIVGPRRFAALGLGVTTCLVVAWHMFDQPAVRFQLDMLFFVPYLPLFVIGILAYEGMIRRQFTWVLPGFILAWMMCLSMLNGWIEIAAVSVFCLLFLSLAFRPTTLSWLAFPPLAGLRTISYALYLLHQNIGLVLIGLLPQGLEDMTYFGWVLSIFAIMIAVSWLVFILVEKPSQGLAQRLAAGGWRGRAHRE